MSNYVETFNWQDIQKHAADDVAEHMIRVWLEERGRLNNRLVQYSDQLLICNSPNPLHPKEPAPIRISGRETLACEFFGMDWSEKPLLAQEVMSTEYRELVATAHHICAQSNEPVFDLISTEMGDDSLQYQRLILPFTNRMGRRFLFCYTMRVGSQPLIIQRSSDKYASSYMPQNMLFDEPSLLAAR